MYSDKPCSYSASTPLIMKNQPTNSMIEKTSINVEISFNDTSSLCFVDLLLGLVFMTFVLFVMFLLFLFFLFFILHKRPLISCSFYYSFNTHIRYFNKVRCQAPSRKTE